MIQTHTLKSDVVVVGGGMSGVCAAIAAARHNASVMLIQDRSMLGGNASSEIRMHICGADCSGGRPDVDARETGIIEEIRLEDAVRNPQRSASMLDVLLWEWTEREPKLTVLLNTHCYGVEMDTSSRIGAVLASRPSTEETFRIEGALFLDCTGDGRLGAEAGAEYRVGREAQNEYGESFAPEEADTYTLGSSILFTARDMGRPMPFVPPAGIRTFTDEDLPFRGHGQFEYGYWWVEWGGMLDTLADNERIRDELLRIALGMWDHIKNGGDHGAENWALDWIGMLPGKRESRRFVGDHMLTQQDVQNAVLFEDRVAYGGWPIDLHPPEGIESPEPPCAQHRLDDLFSIPLRSLYSRNIENMLMAGRHISATHVAFASTRVMATCAVMGQAAGTAAAFCAARECTPRSLVKDGIAELQQALLRDDAYLIELSGADPEDLVQGATVRASTETPEGPAANILNGIARGTKTATNRWISDPDATLPQQLELDFGRTAQIQEIHLTFDTGLTRPLSLSQSDAFTARMIRGPQPEAVRDYTVEVVGPEGRRTIVEISGNHQRKRIHRFTPVDARGVRLIVRATNGAPSARVFEVRAY